MPDSKNSALVLPEEAASSSEPQAIGGFPGRWIPGVPYAPEALGLTLAEARAKIKELNLPIKVVQADEVLTGEFAPASGHAPLLAAPPAAPEPVEAEPMPAALSEPAVVVPGEKGKG